LTPPISIISNRVPVILNAFAKWPLVTTYVGPAAVKMAMRPNPRLVLLARFYWVTSRESAGSHI